MHAAHIPGFETTVNLTNQWLQDIQERMGWAEPQRAYHALRVVLHALRDRLSADNAAALGAQLPLLVRGIYYDGWHPHGKPVKERKLDAFLAPIAAEFRDTPNIDPEDVTRAVFGTIAKHVTRGEVKHLKITMPEELRSLWTPEAAAHWY